MEINISHFTQILQFYSTYLPPFTLWCHGLTFPHRVTPQPPIHSPPCLFHHRLDSCQFRTIYTPLHHWCSTSSLVFDLWHPSSHSLYYYLSVQWWFYLPSRRPQHGPQARKKNSVTILWMHYFHFINSKPSGKKKYVMLLHCQLFGTLILSLANVFSKFTVIST